MKKPVIFYMTKKHALPDHFNGFVRYHTVDINSKSKLACHKNRKATVFNLPNGIDVAFEKELNDVVVSLITRERNRYEDMLFTLKMQNIKEAQILGDARRRVIEYNKLPWWKKVFIFNIKW